MVVVDGKVELVVTTGDGRSPDLATVDTLARLQLVARRAGCAIRLRDPGDDLCALLELAGLAEVIAGGTSRRYPAGVAARAVDPYLKAIEKGWQEFRTVVGGFASAELDRATASGWTAKEMLGHVAFWEEAVEPVIVAMYRGGQLGEDWAFGSGYTHPDGPWPRTDEHNAREAAWASPLPPAVVLARLDAAHSRALDVVRSVSDEELQEPRYQRYIRNMSDHYDEHRQELEAVRPGR